VLRAHLALGKARTEERRQLLEMQLPKIKNFVVRFLLGAGQSIFTHIQIFPKSQIQLPPPPTPTPLPPKMSPQFKIFLLYTYNM
jgi:hypothetical protein